MSMVEFRPAATPAPAAARAARGRVYLDSLGCAKNLVDSEATLGLLAAAGWERAPQPADADVLVVNTCGFLDAARGESIDRILELALWKTTARPRVLAVLGCLVARAEEELRDALPEVDVWLPAGRHAELPARLAGALAEQPEPALRRATDRSGSGRAPAGAFAGFAQRVLLTAPHTTYLKISEGCTNACSFCSIPLMRGLQRSRPLADLVEEARALVARGAVELHLVAQDLTHYGFDLEARVDLLDVVEALSAIDGLEWIRLLYAHPAHLTPRMLEGLFRVPKVLPYLDMPIQHASPAVLRRMNRPYGPERVRAQVEQLRAAVPDITLRTTVIVGHPGETGRDFDRLARFLDEVPFDRLGIFTYSREPGTAANDFGGRPRASTATARLHALQDMQMHRAAARAAARVGSEVRVLVDAPVDDDASRDLPIAAGATAVGRTAGEALDIDGAVYLESGRFEPGSFVRARVVASDVYDLRARPCDLST
jgi:ribosomal protein S12 methylthiotransferase